MLLLASGNGNFHPYEEFIQDVYQTLDQIGGIGSGHRFYGIGRDICRSRGIFIFFDRLPVLDHMAEECLLTHSDDPKNNQNIELRYTRLSLLTGGSSTSNLRRVTICTSHIVVLFDPCLAVANNNKPI